MRARRLIGLVFVAVLAAAAAAPVDARTPVDPTTLTPPLQPFRVCWELGPYVQCDTSGDVFRENEPTDVAPCGQIYETAEFKSNSTRWYEDGLIIRRQVQASVKGFWTLSPTGDGPRVDFMRNNSWNELFAVPATSPAASQRSAALTCACRRSASTSMKPARSGPTRPSSENSQATIRSAASGSARCS